MKFANLLVPVVAALALLAQPCPAAAKSAPALAIPRVSAAIPVTADSKPFLYAQKALDGVGYVEEEYFLSGQAQVYDWAGSGHKV